jgi:hypothetical protein
MQIGGVAFILMISFQVAVIFITILLHKRSPKVAWFFLGGVIFVIIIGNIYATYVTPA